jgi:hypothetical protein
MKIGIISYCDHLRTNAHLNHHFYAEKNQYTYIFDITPTENTKFFRKVDKILKFIDLFDYILWIDDDAIFTNFDKKIEDFIALAPNEDFIFCESPLCPTGIWTFLSAGNFIIKNTENAKEIIKKCLSTDLNYVKSWWDSSKCGFFTNSDQDVWVYLINTEKNVNYKRLVYSEFNARVYHFVDNRTLNQHFLCHFVGFDKFHQMLDFAKKWNLDTNFLPSKSLPFSLQGYNFYARVPLIKERNFFNRLFKFIKRKLKF